MSLNVFSDDRTTSRAISGCTSGDSSRSFHERILCTLASRHSSSGIYQIQIADETTSSYMYSKSLINLTLSFSDESRHVYANDSLRFSPELILCFWAVILIHSQKLPIALSGREFVQIHSFDFFILCKRDFAICDKPSSTKI